MKLGTPRPLHLKRRSVKECGLYSRLLSVFVSSGGATQNAIRVAQWMLQRRNATTYFGCVGADDMASEMRKAAEQVGVKVVYQVNQEHGTGVYTRDQI